MRIVSILIALTVSLVLYVFVFERDKLGEFAGKTSPETVEDAETTQEDDSQAFAPPADRAEAEEKSVKVVARSSVAQTLDSAVILRGQSEAARSVNVASETSGRVTSEPLRKGAYVEAGQLLCELDPGTRASSLLEARANLPSSQARVIEARARLLEAQNDLENAQKLAKGGYATDTRVISSEAGVESARASLNAAEAGIESANSAIIRAETEIARLSIAAPFSGLLESDTAELGTLMQPGSVCATVIQLDPMKLVAYAPEADVDRIEVGTLAGARFLNGTEVTGRVTFLSRSADPNTRTFRVEIEIPNSDFAIRDGQTVEMGIQSEGKSAHLVSQSAITLNDAGELGLRLVNEADKVEFVGIEVIRDTPQGIWVAGLPETADIIVVGQEFVRAGVHVEAHFEEISQ